MTTNGEQFDTAGLDAAARFCERHGEEGAHHAATIRRSIKAHEALADRFLIETAEIRGQLGQSRR